MLEGTARTWLKGLPANSIGSWAELKARFIQNFKDTCKQPMSIVDLASCVQEEGESTTHWVRRVSTILHSSDHINADSAVLMLKNNCRFLPLKQKLGRLKRHCNDMGELIVPRTPSLRKSQERERRVAVTQGSNITRRIRKATVREKLIIV